MSDNHWLKDDHCFGDDESRQFDLSRLRFRDVLTVAAVAAVLLTAAKLGLDFTADEKVPLRPVAASAPASAASAPAVK